MNFLLTLLPFKSTAFRPIPILFMAGAYNMQSKTLLQPHLSFFKWIRPIEETGDEDIIGLSEDLTYYDEDMQESDANDEGRSWDPIDDSMDLDYQSQEK